MMELWRQLCAFMYCDVGTAHGCLCTPFGAIWDTARKNEQGLSPLHSGSQKLDAKVWRVRLCEGDHGSNHLFTSCRTNSWEYADTWSYIQEPDNSTCPLRPLVVGGSLSICKDRPTSC